MCTAAFIWLTVPESLPAFLCITTPYLVPLDSPQMPCLLPRLTGDDYSVQVNLSDYLDILCPHYPANQPPSGPVETLALYLVSKAQFRGCVETKEAIKRWECNQPYAPYGPVRFSEKIQRFTPFSLGFEFLPGHHYYYS
ncbi:hypothetical protein cypCar_00045121, partial [Cyprinus carpio]